MNKTMNILKGTLLASMLMCSALLTAQTSLFVSPQGSDKNKGSMKSPLKTLHQAKQKALQQSGDVTV